VQINTKSFKNLLMVMALEMLCKYQEGAAKKIIFFLQQAKKIFFVAYIVFA
jgi:hypothetical protein